MQKMIERFVTHSIKGDLYEKAFDCLKTLREACVSEDEPASFNRFAEKLKGMFYRTGKSIAKDDSENFFKLMVKNKMTLITKHESKLENNVDQQDANDFLDVDIEMPPMMSSATNPKKDDMVDDIE